ncbi:FecR domain-containing protein [Hymenobacter sp.]|uniref:FecR family protein n=1 Tax=Hymenobacter sp. TaxID=1898978 RepID=UPI00286C4B5B|nr:FecR domain-containing protein [Hymenobacter sp.]
MNYAAYSAEDFLVDESFQAFVFESDPAAVAFWRGWIIQHPAKEAEFYEAAAVLQQLVGRSQPAPEALKREELAKLWHSMQQPAPPRAQPALRTGRRAIRTRNWAVAAVAALVLTLTGLGLWQRPEPAAAFTRYATRSGERRQVVLPDGSRVTLNSNSALRLAAAWAPGQPREVWLTGEAYFNVQHTAPAELKAVAAAPHNVKFTVHARALDVAVLGTQFTVLQVAGKTKVVLNEGQIQLSRRVAGNPAPLLMKPGELVEYNEAAPQTPLVKRVVRPEFYSAWTSGHLDFDNTPVAEIITLLEDTYGLRITLANPALRQQKLTGSIPNHDLDVLLNAVGKSLDVTVRREGNRVWLD